MDGDTRLNLIPMMPRMIRSIILAVWLLSGVSVLVAGIAEDLLILHLDAIGGRGVVDRLTTVHKEGYNLFGERQIPIRIWGAVPNRIRIETDLDPETTLIQGYDGTEVWQVRVRNGKVREDTLSEDEKRQFVDEAWLHGPLVDSEARGMKVDYQGISVIGENRGFLISVTRGDDLFCEVLIADDNYQLAAKRINQLIRGYEVPVLHQYSKYRPVAGVWLPHRIETVQEDRLLIVTVFETIEAVPDVSPDLFSKPATD